MSADEATVSELSGRIHGGQQPVAGSRVYLYSASSSGYGGSATSLLGGSGYVTTDANGNFSITNSYSCSPGAYVYIVALGGNPGLSTGTNNAELGLMSGLGSCGQLIPSTFITVNEVTTVATAFALAQFSASETQIGTSAGNCVGLANAFATVNNLVSLSTGVTAALTPSGSGIVPQAEINTLANVLAGCVNSDGTGSGCSGLMTAANVSAANGTPVDTLQAAINIAQNPGVNVAALYALSIPDSVFNPF